MEIKIDINGSDVELATFLHSLTINHTKKNKTAFKTANKKKKGRPKKVMKAGPEPAPSDDYDLLHKSFVDHDGNVVFVD